MTLPTKTHQPVAEKYQIDPLVKILVNAQVPATLAVLPEDSCIVLNSQLPRLQPEWELALALAQYLGQIEGHGLVFDVQWLIRFNSKTVATVMVFINKPVGFSMTIDSLNEAVATFMTLLVPQSDLISNHSLPTSDGVVASAAMQAVEMYLDRYGGKPVVNQLMVETGSAQIACIKGSWPKAQAIEKIPQFTTHLARYDGRRLSTRKAFFRLEKGGIEGRIQN